MSLPENEFEYLRERIAQHVDPGLRRCSLVMKSVYSALHDGAQLDLQDLKNGKEEKTMLASEFAQTPDDNPVTALCKWLQDQPGFVFLYGQWEVHESCKHFFTILKNNSKYAVLHANVKRNEQGFTTAEEHEDNPTRHPYAATIADISTVKKVISICQDMSHANVHYCTLSSEHARKFLRSQLSVQQSELQEQQSRVQQLQAQLSSSQ